MVGLAKLHRHRLVSVGHEDFSRTFAKVLLEGNAANIRNATQGVMTFYHWQRLTLKIRSTKGGPRYARNRWPKTTKIVCHYFYLSVSLGFL